MDIFEAIRGRRSVREFLPDPVAAQDLERILDAARYAPTAGNAQPWRFLLIRDQANRAALKAMVYGHLQHRIERLGLAPEKEQELRARFGSMVERLFVAPVWVLALVDARQYPDLVLYDGAMAVQNMMLAAYALGYGTSLQTTLFPEAAVRRHLSIPDDYRFVCAVPLGRPAQQPDLPPKRDLASFIWEEHPPDQDAR
jgi:nitroreductase